MEKMTSYLPSIDTRKLNRILEIKEAYTSGKLSLSEARHILKQDVGTIKPYEIAVAEQELKEVEDDECRKEDIQKMLELFEGLMDTTRPQLPEWHPIACYYRENDELRKILLSIDDLVQYPVIKNQWLEIYDRLKEYKLHLARKQNQLYTVLEKKGFDRPTTTMWQLDDFIRNEINEARQLLETDQDARFIAMQPTITADVRDLMQKEETVLYPTSLAMLSDQEFEHMQEGDREIGFAWLDAPKVSAKAPKVSDVPDKGFVAELGKLLGKYGYAANTDAVLDVATGKLTLEQINLIYKHMPVDLSFVDENEKVCFYTDTKHRVFPRSKNVIGRDVKNCHPRASVHIVEEIIEKFRSGEQDYAEFWLNKPGMFIYITYRAVRDEEGHFKGVLEMMQDCTHIRSLEGSRTLLTWNERGTHEQGEQEVQDLDNDSDDGEITPETRLKVLFARYPDLKGRMSEISPRFKMLNTPLARVILQKATVSMASERSGVPVEVLISGIKKIIASETK